VIKLYGVPNCQQIRKTKALFHENNIAYEFIHVKKDPVSEERLKEVVAQLGLDKALNSKGATYRKLGLKQMNLSDEELFAWLLKEQGMIKRPLIEKDGRFWIGYEPEGILHFLEK